MEMNDDRFSAGKLAGLAVVVLYLLAATVAAFATGNGEFVFYIGVMVILLGAAIALHWRVNLSTGAVWALVVWGGMHMAGGLVPVPESWPINGDVRVLYSWWILPGLFKYDHLAHLYGFGVTTVVCWQGLQAAIGPKPATLGLVTLAAAAGMGFGALNEVVEFAATMLVPETNVGGYVNTGWDLVANAAGAVLAAVGIWLLRRESASPANKPAE